jgi:hypothetical protein
MCDFSESVVRSNDKKRTTSELLALRVIDLKKHGVFNTERPAVLTFSRQKRCIDAYGISKANSDLFVVRMSDLMSDDYNQSGLLIKIDETHCHYGGVRHWFKCPECDSRVGVLYDLNNLKCRKCHDLLYPCQRDDQYSHLVRSQMRLLEKVGYPVDWQSRFLPRPKGMHETTQYWIANPLVFCFFIH